ncbi:MAG TPA: hypothetical protein VFX73_11205, partial [Chitinophagaceae bacterium]|nr:hypothetical protein [Chitinophagaceae bacterium]
MTKILPVLVCLVLSVSGFAQIDLRDYDTILIRKPQERKLIYEFDNRYFRAINIKQDKAIAEGNYTTVSETISGPNSLMGILGKGPVPNYLMPASLISEPTGFGWAVDIYRKGTTVNDLVKTSEGKASQIPGYLNFYWQSGWLGLIRQGGDTLAY